MGGVVPAILAAVAWLALSAPPAVADPTVETLSIVSANPRWPSDLLDGLDDDPPQTITARLSLPDGAVSGSVPASLPAPLPAMVIVHGSGGIGPRGADYERMLNAIGVATLRPDSFGPRGVRSTVADQRAVSTFSMVADAYAALRMLAADPRIDPRRIGIMGFSKGGSVA